MNEWYSAFLVTQAVEVPLYWLFARALRPSAQATYAIGASTITHPIIWFCLPWQSGDYLTVFIIAESFAVLVEALWGRLWQITHYWRAALVANISSIGVGLAIREILHQLES